MNKQVIKGLCLCLSWSFAVAEITFSPPVPSGIHFSPIASNLTQSDLLTDDDICLNSSFRYIGTNTQHYEFQGSFNNHPVYINLEDAGQTQVVGYMWTAEGVRQAVHGEWYEHTLQLYDQTNNWVNVIPQ